MLLSRIAISANLITFYVTSIFAALLASILLVTNWINLLSISPRIGSRNAWHQPLSEVLDEHPSEPNLNFTLPCLV